MENEVQVAAFEGGQLRLFTVGDKSREAVLALPLNRLLLKMVRVPADQDPVAFATPVLQAMSPFPDETLTVSCETVKDGPEGKVVIAAALPEGATDDLGEALDAAKLNVTRIDALLFGELRGLWPQLGVGDGRRRLVLIRSVDCLSAVLLDGDQPSAVRALSGAADLRREIMLCLLEAEDFGGARELAEIVLVGREGEETAAPAGDLSAVLSAFAPVRTLRTDADAALRGVAERSAEAGTLDALPEGWREVLEETRFKHKLAWRLGVAVGFWVLVMGVLFGVPVVYGFLTDHQKQLCTEHSKQYRHVEEMKGKVELVRKYSDHSRGALEIMKAVSDRLPAGVELNSWNFKREDGVRFAGEADTANEVYELKDRMIALAFESGDGEGDSEPVFSGVELNGPSAGKGGRQRFEISCLYKTEEGE